MKRIAFALLLLSGSISFSAFAEVWGDEKAAIKKILLESYVKGIHINRDVELARTGFHPDFTMHVLSDNQIIKVSLDMWLDRLQLDRKKNEDTIDYKFESIDITGNAATAKMLIFENSKHIYTDYFSLYKFKDGWKIVGKIFYGHD